MLSPLKPLLCRHDFYWSERHAAERCRRCGKTSETRDPNGLAIPDPDEAIAGEAAVIPSAAAADPDEDFLMAPVLAAPPPMQAVALPEKPRRPAPSDKVLKAQAADRRQNLLTLLDRLAQGRQPTRQDAIDAVLAVIEDAHSSDPVLFGEAAADHFARLHDARSNLIF